MSGQDRQNHYGRTILGIGLKDRKDDDASRDLLLRIAAGAAHAKWRCWDRKMIRRKKIFIMATTLATALVIPAVIYFAPGPIEGFWWNHDRDCLCDCHRFWHFRSGEVIEYRSQHLPPIFIGTYEKTGWNTYRFRLLGQASPESSYTLHGGQWFLRFGRSSALPNASLYDILTSYLYRVRDTRKNEAVLRMAEKQQIVYPNAKSSQQSPAGDVAARAAPEE